MKRLLGLLFATSAAAQTFSPVPFTFAVGQQVNPAQLMADLNSVINNGNGVAAYLNSQIASVTPPPSGAIMFFYLTACPAGWTPIGADLQFVRGLDAGRGLDTTGTAVGASETASIVDHTHATGTLVTSDTTVTINSGANNTQVPITLNNSSNPATGTAATGNFGATMRPVNFGLKLCQKT